MDKKSLPISHTCFMELDVPIYLSYDILVKKFNSAFIEGCDFFGFG